MERDIDMPVGIDCDAMDLIDRLLELEPDERIGAGPDGFK